MAERELEELKCYACNGKVCQMCYTCNEVVCQKDSCQFKDWADMYKKDLKSYISRDATWHNVQRYYSDPDSSYKKKTDHSFFCDLVKFLIRREEEMSDCLQGSFKYRFIEDEGIEVSGTYSKGEEMQPFYLRSDQFGFSAPTNRKAHPYDLYIAKHENKDKAIEQVKKWISMSRTIGGSFLWSKSPDDSARNSFYAKYNMRRGGTITCNRSKYIQDRVDLTLWEIKDWYNSKHNGGEGILERQSILVRCSEKKTDIEQWLLHFGDFETYAKYFMFDKSQFVDKSYNPINIITGKSDAPIGEENGKNPEPAITFFMEFASLETMLNTLNEKIVKRSIEMTKIIDKEKQGS